MKPPSSSHLAGFIRFLFKEVLVYLFACLYFYSAVFVAQQKLDYHIAAGMQFSVGDRCKVRVIWNVKGRLKSLAPKQNALLIVFMCSDHLKVCLNGSGRDYTATIKQLASDDGLVTVYSEEFGLK